MFAEEDLLPLSGLQHLAFCERQWALIHLEGQWAENRLTAEGRVLHERSDSGEGETRGDVRIARGVRLRSLRLGLVGQADVVEWHRVRDRDPPEDAGARLPGREGWWRPMPVEYKRGRPKPERMDEVQVCAQALCLEEMLSVRIERAALFYGQPRRRSEVPLDDALRAETEALAARMHALFRAGRTPVAKLEKKCRNCSLFERCRPDATSRRSVARYLEREVFTPEL
jgi:CRISPR-associated exonuclease Cas4